MKKTVIEYITDAPGDIPKHSLLENKVRLRAFFSEQETIEKREGRFISRYAFYSVESLRRHTKQSLFKAYKMLRPDLKCIQPGQIPDTNMEYKDVVLYGEDSSLEIQERLAEYLRCNAPLKIQLSFHDKEDCGCKQDMAYAELQKALFFCKRKKYLLLFVSVRNMMQDIRFYDLLEEFRVDFRCIDFPWFCKENVKLIKAVMLYEKLEPESEAR